LLETLRVATWREQGLREMLISRDGLFGPDHMGDERRDVVAEMHREALGDRARISKLCIDAGLEKRMAEIAERQADILDAAVGAALRAAGVTDSDALARADAALVQVLKARSPAGAELN
jgi:hypothetical protein